jgi:Ran GTPase-activating protein (RanGAP) involved in mRNA processing and transport
MNYYKCSQKPFDIKFPHLQEKTFISLAVIEKTSVSRASADTFTKGTLHGHADEILKKKKPIELEAVLEPPDGQQSMKCVFVEGAPGIGKSTFALELCRRQEGSRTYSLVVLLRLREDQVHKIQSISDLFYHKPDLQQAVTEEVIACEGKNILFILDGFDELPAKLRSSSFIVELIQGKHLPACTVVVTSRPSATADLLFSCKTQINKRIEILGFTHERVKQYAESMLSDEPDVLQDFLRYISNNPAIHGMMYIPLNSAIVLAIYKDNRTINEPVPHTLTQLYMELCLALLRKYLTERCDPLVEEVHSTFKDLPETLKDQLIKLGKLAFEGAKREEITFKQLPDGCDGLGFMNISTEFYLGRKSVVSYSFLHLTLQEFLAAFYISQLPGIEQKLLYIENNQSLLYPQVRVGAVPLEVFCKYLACRSLGCNMDVMWRFMAGLTGFREIGWELVHKAIHKPISSSQNHVCHPPLLIQCLFEVHDVRELKRICDIIVKNVQLINKYLLRQLTDFSFINVEALSLFDCYAVGYCIAASKHEWSVDLSLISGDEVVKMFACGLRCIGDLDGYFSALNLSNNSLTYQAITYLNEISSEALSKIETLILSDNQLDSTALATLSDTILKMDDLSHLSIANNPVGSGGMIKLLGVSINIRELDLVETNLGPNDIIALSQLIEQSTNLKELSIGDKAMSNECVALLIETILSPASLDEVNLWWLQFTGENARKFKQLESNNNLHSLKFMNCSIGLDLAVPYVAEALHKNESLAMLGIPYKASEELTPINRLKKLLTEQNEYDVNFGESSIRALSEMLKVNKTLKYLIIYTANLNDDDILTLISALQINSTLENLVFHPKVKLISERLSHIS